MEPPPRSLALDAHYCIMVRVPWPAEYKYASAIGCASWRAPLGIDSVPNTTCDRRRNAEPMASAFPGSRRGDGRPSNKQRDKTTRSSAVGSDAAFVIAEDHVHDPVQAVASRPEEFHLRPLTERCGSLSAHTAPTKQPVGILRDVERLRCRQGLLLLPVGR